MAENTTPVAQKSYLFFKSKRFTSVFNWILSTLLILLGTVVVLTPLAWMISTSLKGSGALLTLPPEWIPKEAAHAIVNGEDLFVYNVTFEDGTVRRLAAIKLDPVKSEFVDPADPTQIYYAPADKAKQYRQTKVNWSNYPLVWNYQNTPFGLFMKNTLVYALVAVFGEVLTCSLVAYGFARLRAPGKNFLFMVVLGTMMLPGAVTMIPSYVLFTNYIPKFFNGLFGTNLVLADTWWPLMIPKFFGSAYLIFLMRQFFLSIPKDYDEAARIDGCGFFQTWWRIIIPMSRPVLVATAILSFMYHWNDYMGPLIYLSTTEKLPLSVGLMRFTASYGGTHYSLLMAGGLIAVFPLFIIFFLLNRYFVQGVVVSGIKG